MLRPKKHFGQNFLQDEMILSRIVTALPIAGKHIVEVGPGYGALTDFLVREHPESLELVEIDPDMIRLLDENIRTLWQGSPIHLIERDVLTYVPTRTPYSVIANIPYYITAPIIEYFLSDLSVNPEYMVLMMQKEVGEKILSAGASPRKGSAFANLIEYRTEKVWEICRVPRTAFFPEPKVDSIVLGFSVLGERSREEEQALRHIWKQAFTQPRKTFLSNMLGTSSSREGLTLWLREGGYDPLVRAERLTLDDWKSFLLFTHAHEEK